MPKKAHLVAELLGASSVAALLVNGDGVVVSANAPAEAMLGYEEGELSGRALSNVCTAPRGPASGEIPLLCSARDGRRIAARAETFPCAIDGKPFEVYVLRGEPSGQRPRLDERFQDAILEIARAPEVASGDFRAAVQRIIALVARVMHVERVSVWLFVDEGRILESVSLYEVSHGLHQGSVRLRAEDYPAYFAAIEAGRVVSANDAPRDPCTCEFAHGYLDVLGITSMLDSVIRVSGKVIGVVCHEHTGKPRTWREDEIVFAAEVADQVASAYLVSKNKEAEAARQKLEEELRQSQKLEAIGRLAGGVAHDFNNLLSVILGYAELAEQEQVSPSVRTFLTEIRAAGKRAAELTSQLLSIGRRQVLQARPVDVNELVEKVLKLLRPVIPEDVEIEFRPHSSPAMVQADPGQLEQALMNLCLNARDATQGGGHIYLRVRVERGHERVWVVLAVEDDGVGMPPEVLERVFEPFFTTKGPGRGTGLGLSMVYGIAAQHGGRVEVRSQPGEGTLFEVRLPYLADARPEATAPEAAKASLAGAGEHVLVAEDADSIRELVRRTLQAAGYRVTLARDGDEVVRLHRELARDVDLVMLDVVMPKRNGRDAFEAIRSQTPGVAMLFTTGYGAEALSEDFLQEHGIEVLHKPWNAQVLLSAVRRALTRRAKSAG
jgi:signal transduction histidine kinase/CheY-like chemotaxis protein